MQIVRDLAGYTLGRSDLLRRAMSKKKSSRHGKKNVRILSMEMKKKACRAASKTEFQKKLQIISMMR